MLRLNTFSKYSALALALIGVALVTNYAIHDQERRDLGDDARRGAPGSFVRLTDGIVHYELAGAATIPPLSSFMA